jgi:hypothetical protein
VIRQLVAALDALPAAPRGPTACPADDGSQILVIASYRDRPTETVNVGLTGCQVVRRGSVVRWALPSRGAVIQRLEALTPVQ